VSSERSIVSCVQRLISGTFNCGRLVIQKSKAFLYVVVRLVSWNLVFLSNGGHRYGRSAPNISRQIELYVFVQGEGMRERLRVCVRGDKENERERERNEERRGG